MRTQCWSRVLVAVLVMRHHLFIDASQTPTFATPFALHPGPTNPPSLPTLARAVPETKDKSLREILSFFSAGYAGVVDDEDEGEQIA